MVERVASASYLARREDVARCTQVFANVGEVPFKWDLDVFHIGALGVYVCGMADGLEEPVCFLAIGRRCGVVMLPSAQASALIGVSEIA